MPAKCRWTCQNDWCDKDAEERDAVVSGEKVIMCEECYKKYHCYWDGLRSCYSGVSDRGIPHSRKKEV